MRWKWTKHFFEVTDGWGKLCTWCGHAEFEADLHYRGRLPKGWQTMEFAPKNATKVEIMLENGWTGIAHWAQDLSGEEQPPFSGWFRNHGDGYAEIDDPVAWRPLKSV